MDTDHHIAKLTVALHHIMIETSKNYACIMQTMINKHRHVQDKIKLQSLAYAKGTHSSRP